MIDKIEVGKEYVDEHFNPVKVNYIGERLVIYTESYRAFECCISLEKALEIWTLLVEKPKLKKLYAYITERLSSVVIHAMVDGLLFINEKGVTRRPEYDIEFPLEGE